MANDHIRVRQPFAQIPEWILDGDSTSLTSTAVRLYGILQRYGNSPGGSKVPSRGTLARRCMCSVRTIVRAKEELIFSGALTIEERPGKTHLYILESDPCQKRTGSIFGTTPVPKTTPDREQGTERALVAKATRARDPLWDTLADLFGGEAKGKERDRWNTALKSLRSQDATPELLRRAAAAYLAHPTFKDCAMTAMALTSNWTVLSGNGKTPHELKADNLRARIAAQEGTTR